MKRRVVRALLRGNVEVFHKSPNTKDAVDSFDELGVHAYFDNDDNLEYVDTFFPCNPTIEGIVLIGEDLEGVIERLRAIGYENRFEDGAHFFDVAGFALFSTENEVQGVSVYRKGYYDD